MKIKTSLILFALVSLISSCTPTPNPREQIAEATQIQTREILQVREYLDQRAHSGLQWKLRAQDLVEKAKSNGSYQGNEAAIGAAYARVNSTLSTWASVASEDALRYGHLLKETPIHRERVESAVEELSVATKVAETKTYWLPIVAELLPKLFSAVFSGPVGDTASQMAEEKVKHDLVESFKAAHLLAPL